MNPWLIATYNVNGIRARQETLLSWLAANKCQVAALQETKVQDSDFPAQPFQENGYALNYAGQKSFNGVALLSLERPDEIISALPGQEGQGARFQAARFADVWVINSYVPQGRAPDNPAFQDKLVFIRTVGEFIKENKFKNLVWLGDINVAPGQLDVYDPVKLKGQVGFHPEEQAALAETMEENGLKDLFREMHPEEQAFTFWDYRAPNGFKRNLGWRIDLMLVSPSMLARCRECWVDKHMRGQDKPSDHAPLLARF